MKYILLMICLISTQVFSQTLSIADGKKINIKELKAPALIVNIATRCGYTPQLDGLEKLYQKYKEKGFLVIGIPSNDFASQTPEDNKEVKKFCRLKYGVNFPLSKKTPVTGKTSHPLIKKLIAQDNKGEIKWNFEKFLIDKDGNLVERFRSNIKPLSEKITKKIDEII